MKPKTIVIVGNAKYVDAFDLHKLDGIETIGCNRILLHPYFRPTHLVVCDRRPYIPELESGRLQKWADKGDILLSTTLWDPNISCANTPVQKRPKFRHREFPLSGSRSKMNWESLKKPFCSCANTGIALFQFARVLGATRIGVTGIGLVPPVDLQKGHFYGEDEWGQQPSSNKAFLAAERARDELKAMGVPVFNLSLEKAEMENLFGRYDFDKFIRET